MDRGLLLGFISFYKKGHFKYIIVFLVCSMCLLDTVISVQVEIRPNFVQITSTKCFTFSFSVLLFSSVSSSGVIPSTDFLKGSGVPLSSRGDVIVDKVRVCWNCLITSISIKFQQISVVGKEGIDKNAHYRDCL